MSVRKKKKQEFNKETFYTLIFEYTGNITLLNSTCMFRHQIYMASVNVTVRTVVVKSSTKLHNFVSNFHNGVWDYWDPR